MDLIPERLVDDGLMLAGIARAFVDGLAEVEPVAEQLVQEPLVDRLAALVQGAARHQLPGQQGGRSQLDKPLEDVAARSGLGLVDHQLAVDDVVPRSEEHTSELQSLMRNSYAVFCLKKKTNPQTLTDPSKHNTRLPQNTVT